MGNKGISIFVMDRDTPGISATKLDKLGWRASDTGEIAFDNVEIPAGGAFIVRKGSGNDETLAWNPTLPYTL